MGDVFGDIMTVCVGANHGEILTFAKKHNYRKELLEYIKENPEDYDLISSGDKGRFIYNHKIRFLFLVLEHYEDNWDFWENLLHEIHHAVFRFAQIKSFEKETELQARLFEHLFRDIRKKLQGYKPVWLDSGTGYKIGGEEILSAVSPEVVIGRRYEMPT